MAQIINSVVMINPSNTKTLIAVGDKVESGKITDIILDNGTYKAFNQNDELVSEIHNQHNRLSWVGFREVAEWILNLSLSL